MGYVLPLEILNCYGRCEITFLNGGFWMLPPENLEAICAALESLGWEVESAEDLSFS